MIAPTTREILRVAQYVLVREDRNGAPAGYRCKMRAVPRRVSIADVNRLAAAGLLEIGPRSRWARLTQAGRQALETA